MTDARFEDGDERPLYLGAQDAEDLKIVSALVQDAVLPITEMRYRPGRRQFLMLINRFRWEDRVPAPERVRALLAFDGVLGVRSQGIDRTDRDLVLSVLSLRWTPGDDGAGVLELVLAGDGAVALQMEALDVTLRDVTRPYVAPSRRVPNHD
ncbi:DUF2948 family protein [Falsirhodobacter algicola]|uniref:DUF2948 family protein n=1 Tax=Falsirhodobacter algicola TaxID=2692330 RepID=A0A8J8MQQ5_9RHOB|nr:DUF2948 family protein [Falsirhodobacter algicola]QUS34967.1 DUF2948 family protein [Falsirhodobacter algicola]